MLVNLLVYRFVLANVCFAAMGAYYAMNGSVMPLYAGDSTHITIAITVLFGVGWLWMVREIVCATRMLNRQESVRKSTGHVPKAPRGAAHKDMAKIEWLMTIPAWLVGLGLLGTVIGFWIAFSGVDPDSLTSANGVSTVIAVMARGMGAAITTTILGSVFGMWLEVCGLMLRTALIGYWAEAGGLDHPDA